MQKTAILENWFAVDYILLGERADKVLNGNSLKEYLSNKGPLFSNLIEVYKSINYVTDKTYKSTKELKEGALDKANVALNVAREKLKSSDVASIIKEEIQESGKDEGLTESQVAKYIVSKKFKEIALDALLFENVIDNEVAKDKLNEWTGKVLVDSHKILRDDTITSSVV